MQQACHIVKLNIFHISSPGIPMSSHYFSPTSPPNGSQYKTGEEDSGFESLVTTNSDSGSSSSHQVGPPTRGNKYGPSPGNSGSPFSWKISKIQPGVTKGVSGRSRPTTHLPRSRSRASSHLPEPQRFRTNLSLGSSATVEAMKYTSFVPTG